MEPARPDIPQTFGRRREPHHVIIARGETVRSFTVRPWLVAGGLCAVFLVMAVYLGATAYLVFRDNLMDARSDKTAQLRMAYEDRIADLRAQNDRITSRQLIDRRTYEEQIKKLLARQMDLDQRQGRIAAVIDRASRSGLALTLGTRLPSAKPDAETVAETLPENRDAVGGEALLLSEETGPFGLRGSVAGDLDIIPLPEPAAGRIGKTSRNTGHRPASVPQVRQDAAAAPLITGSVAKAPADGSEPNHGNLAIMDRISSELIRMDRQTATVLDAIAVSAERRIGKIREITEPLGLDAETDGDAMGGPFVPLVSSSFDARLERADRAIDRLDSIRRAAETLPLGQPVSHARTSSRFGHRMDPFLGRPAMHTGIDFKATRGTAVRATAPGRVVSAGRNGGYGLMVEIDHGNGLTTRYAHLNRIRVAAGTEVETGAIIGNVGSSGRSTGPHLHYETRQHGAARNPAPYLSAGKRLAQALAD